MNPYHHKVSDLLSRPGSRREVQFEAPLELSLTQAQTAGPALVELRLEAASDEVLASGTLVTPVELRCNRCLVSWTDRITVPFRTHFDRTGSDDAYPLEADEIDLEPLIRDEVALAVPLAPLCQPDCAGLCPTCGTDLNVSPCMGHESVEDSPFAALQHLLDQD